MSVVCYTSSGPIPYGSLLKSGVGRLEPTGLIKVYAYVVYVKFNVLYVSNFGCLQHINSFMFVPFHYLITIGSAASLFAEW